MTQIDRTAATFRIELANLLEQYGATIRFTCDDSCDTHGFTGDQLVIINNQDNQLFAAGSWEFDHDDLRKQS